MNVINKKNNYSEKALVALCVVLWFLGSLVRPFWILCNRFLHIPYGLSLSFIMPVIIICLIIASMPLIIKRVNSSQLFLYGLFSIIFIISIIQYPDNPALKELGIGYFFLYLPYIFLGSCFDIKRLYKIFYVASLLVLVKETFYLFVFRAASDMLEDGGEYISAAYNLLPSILFLIWHSFNRPKYYNILLSIFGVFILSGYGNRGSLVCVFIFVFVLIALRLFDKQKPWKIIGLVAVFGFVYIFLDEILINVELLLNNLGFSNRVFYLTTEYGLGEDSSTQGRLYYYSQALSALDSGLWGFGMAGDRIPLQGGYSHNIIVECIVSYGYFGGSLFLLSLFLLLIKAIRKVKIYEEQVFLFLLICIGFIQAFISGSYVNNIWFYFLLGYCTKIISKTNKYSVSYV